LKTEEAQTVWLPDAQSIVTKQQKQNIIITCKYKLFLYIKKTKTPDRIKRHGITEVIK